MSLNTGNAILSNAITVDGSYNVGIGTSTPLGKLHVSSPTAVSAYIVSSGGDYDTNLYLGYGSVNTETYIKRIVGNLVIGTSNVDRLTLSSTGAATFSSSVKSVGRVFSTSDANYGDLTSTTGALVMSFDSTGQQGYLTSRNYSTSTDTPLNYSGSKHIFSGGNVGIGTTPLSWYSSNYVALQIGGMSGLFANTTTTSVTGAATLTYNLYVDTAGNYQYMNTTNARAGSLMVMEGGNIYFSNAAAGTGANPTVTERMRITSGGLISMGNTSVSNGTAFGGGGQINRLKVESGNYTCLEINGSTSGGSIQFTYGTNLPNQVGALIGYNYASGTVNEMNISNILNGAMTFATNNTERMRITSGGTLLVGKTSAGAINDGLEIEANGNLFAYITNAQSTLYVYDISTPAYRFYVTGAGQINATSTSITAISDVSLKENIKDLETGLSEVLKLRPRRFDWKDETGLKEKNVAGFIAQELENVLPELVYEYQYDKEQTKKSIKMGDILPTLVKAIQEQQAQIEAQQQQINQLINK